VTKQELNRRQALKLLGAAGMGSVVFGACQGSDETGGSPTTQAPGSSTTSTGPAASTPGTPITAERFANAAACTVTPEQTEGPFYIDVDNVRSDIREDRQGAQLRVAARVMDTDGCTPVKDAVFEIWHCDAGGAYSGFGQASRGPGGPPGGGPSGGSSSTDQARFLRGAQVTNAEGIAVITTVYPGWYQGRTVHIHAKVHLSKAEALTTQFYFDDNVSDEVFATAPYNQRTGRRTINAGDNIYRRETTLTVSKEDGGYLGLITIGIKA
jgi:protocatechuate 3,4-dioxygenase beta subunit